MKVNIPRNCWHTIDCFVLKYFEKGQIYDVREFTATSLIQKGLAISVKEKIYEYDESNSVS